MVSEEEWSVSGDDSDFYESSRRTTRPAKRRKLNERGRAKPKKAGIKAEASEARMQPFSLDPVLEALRQQSTMDWEDDRDSRDSFETIIEPLLPEYEESERTFLQSKGRLDEMSTVLYPLSRDEARKIRDGVKSDTQPSTMIALLSAKSRMQPNILRKLLLNRIPSYEQQGTLTPLPTLRAESSVNPQILDALYGIQTTPYNSSFLSRLQGKIGHDHDGAIAVDWETRTPWMNLMCDIREHYSLAHPDREQPVEVDAPITYGCLQACHLPQVHDLLARVFWEGVNVRDSLDYSPEKCTVVATYKKLVVGAAFLSSPQETYITYLVVRAGWDNSQIASSMLYHLIIRNPNKDITLHVSINNPAMLLYNRFGFKAEEFIVGFYEDYLDPNSPQSKNAFRLRLRR
ncbi:hypothetical protein C2E23DRAFT_380880 [Lenzites betulinus]|nr:hypothetical protein C2E23DRAFT_380880 [Lenzites betulinus]